MRTDEQVTRAAETTAAAILRVVGERNRARGTAAALEAEVARVRLEHWRTLASEWGIGRNVPVCGRCRHGDGVPFRWPCPTLQALGDGEPPELFAGDMRDALGVES